MINKMITNGVELKLASGLREIDEKYPRLNSGGCLFVAKCIGEAFRKRGVKVEYLILDNFNGCLIELRNDFKMYANTESLEDLTDRMIEIAHIVPLINDKLFIDSKGVATSIKDTKWSYLHKIGYITHKTIIRWSKDKHYRWNPTFLNNHEHQLLHIEYDIKNLINSLDI